MINKLKKGFTIIELLVVIAIIAVLAAIVLVNVTQYITKGKDAAAEGNLATLLTNGAVLYDAQSSYNNFFTGASPTTATTDCTSGAFTGGAAGNLWTSTCQALENAGYHVTNKCDVALCASPSTKWCAQVTLKASTNTYCVDSSGNKLNKAAGTCVAGVCS